MSNNEKGRESTRDTKAKAGSHWQRAGLIYRCDARLVLWPDSVECTAGVLAERLVVCVAGVVVAILLHHKEGNRNGMRELLAS